MTDPLPDNLLRLYCDNELPSHEAAEVERHLREHAGDRHRVDFEFRLRQRVSGTMRVTTPAQVLERVRAAMAASQAGGADQRQIDEESLIADSPQAAARRPTFSWAAPRRINVFAVAACLALVAGAVLVGIFGRSIDELRWMDSDLLTQASEYVSGEHGRCAGSESAMLDKAGYRTTDDVAEGLGAHLQIPKFHAFDLATLGYEFVGAGRCGVPGDPHSGHLIYRRAHPDETSHVRAGPLISVFVEPFHHQFEVLDGPAGAVYSFPQSQRCRPGRILTDGTLVYFVTACQPADLEAAVKLIKGQLDLADR